MSFWNLSNNEAANTGDTEYEQETGNLAPIPDGSSVLASIDEAKWDMTRNRDAEFISLRWTVSEPAQFANRKIFQKLWVTDSDPNVKDEEKAAKKRDKALRMLAAIDANCGGKLSKKAGRPTNDDLTLCLTNRLMVIKCMVWEITGMDGSTNSGNWIAAVAPKSKGIEVREAKAAPKPAPARGVRLEDDEVPF